jgi:hypothetical protein
MTATTDFTATGNDGRLLTIAVRREAKFGVDESLTTGTIVYDPGMTIPTAVHLDIGGIGDGTTAHGAVDLSLVSDSFAKK